LSGEKKPDPIVDLLYENIHALPSNGSYLNFVPFMQDSEQTRGMKRKMSSAIVDLFRAAGYLNDPSEESRTMVSRDVSIHCRSCSSLLLKTHTDDEGRANVPAAHVIDTIGRLSHECPHEPITPEMQRRRIEAAVLAAEAQR
jgi:hypothetical protein